MFTTHFKMTAHPFSEHTPVENLLRDERVTQGLARLDYLAHEGTLALLSGHTGVGKSSLVRLFLHSLSRNRYQPVYIHLTAVGVTGLLRLIVTSLGEVPKRGRERLFLQILEKARESELTIVLVLDEAQYIEPQALTDLRLLISSVLDERPPLKIILSGQEGLGDQLKQTAHAAFVHRISVRYHMSPLTKDQTACYIDSRLEGSGATSKIFEPEAKDLIHDYGAGFPRQINNIATACLINATTKNLQKISGPLVNETMAEFQLP